ncbi:MAG: hypothetical protein GY928_12005 [Colwellia sp.]|nr:hypothetical protein [Colwellia sp.]
MKNLLNNIAPIEVEIDWDHHDGTYTGRKEINFREWSYSFDIIVMAERKIYSGSRENQEEEDVKVLGIDIMGLEAWKDGVLLLENRELYDRLEAEILDNIQITNI